MGHGITKPDLKKIQDSDDLMSSAIQIYKWLGVMKWAGVPGCVLMESHRSCRPCWWHKLIWASYLVHNGSRSTGFCFTLAKSSLLQVSLPCLQDQVTITYFIVSWEHILPSALRPLIFICVIMWIFSVSLLDYKTFESMLSFCCILCPQYQAQHLA